MFIGTPRFSSTKTPKKNFVIGVKRPNVNDFRHTTWTYHKVFEKMTKKMREKCLLFDSKTRSQFRPACKNQNEISSFKIRRQLWPFGGGKCGKGRNGIMTGGNALKSSELSFPIQC